MPTVKITTKRAIDAIPFTTEGQQFYWDAGLRGFGILVGKRTRTFIMQRDVRGASRRISIGRYPEVTLHAARKKAEQLAGEMAAGIDPVEEERQATADGLTLRQAWNLYQAHLTAKERSPRTGDEYWKSIERYCSDWIDRPLIEITPQRCHARHVKVGESSGKFAANALMRALRAIWRRARRQHRGLGEPPTSNVDFFVERARNQVIGFDELPAWWDGVHKIENVVRRDLFKFILFTGTRRTEAKTLRWEQVDLERGVVRFPRTKTVPFVLPLSKFLIQLLKERRACATTRAVYGKSDWVWPAHSASGHVEEPQINGTELKLFPTAWSPHVLRHTYVSFAENKVAIPSMHVRWLVNHAVPTGGDSHDTYNHPDTDDLRISQEAMSKFLLAAIKPKGGKRKTAA